jgi:LysR family transcriptional regulator for bpeEF and oprC
MDRLQAMRVFTRVLELGSFTRAAEDLTLPRATVTYAIKELETHLSAKLLNRTTRQVSATADGDAYYQRCIRLLADLEETESVFKHATVNPKGKLRVAMHGTQALHFVLPYLPEFCARYPDIELELNMGDRLVDLVREGIDCAIRSGELQDSSLYARRLASFEQITCASPAYLEQHGTPLHPNDLAGHVAVNFFSSRTGRAMPFEFTIDGVVRDQMLPGKISVNNADAYHACCESGFGLIQLPRYGAEAGLARGSLIEVLADFRPPPMSISVLYPHQLQLTPRVRVFVEWVAQRYADAH